MVLRETDYLQMVDWDRQKITKTLLNELILEKEEDIEVTDRTEENKREPNLRIVILKSDPSFTPENIPQSLEILSRSKTPSRGIIRFYEKYLFTIKKLKEAFYLKIVDNHSQQRGHFIIFVNGSFWSVFSIVKKEFFERTFLNICIFTWELEILKTTQRHLENIALLDANAPSVRGFIAKYAPRYTNKDRKLTFNVHGGTLNDLNKIRKSFFVEPTIIRFRIENSPSVECSINTEGYFAFEKIDADALDAASGHIQKFTTDLFEMDKVFADAEKCVNILEPILKKGENVGFHLTSEYILKLKIKEERFSEERIDYTSLEELNRSLELFFTNRRSRYLFYFEEDYGYFVFDKETMNKVQITIEKEGNTYSIILYPFKNCKARTLRDICSGITKDVESSYQEIKPLLTLY